VSKGRILVIDDEISILKFMNNFLTTHGFEVYIASNGLEGIDLAKSGNPDLVITDIKMPIMNGFKLIQELKEDANCRSIPIIVITGYSIEDEDRVKAEQYGVKDYFVKPFQLEEIFKTVSKYVGGAKN
jgi:DNA-binding response OmpR family regulator